MDNNRNMLLNANEKAYIKQARIYLIFESGFCITARKYVALPKIYQQMKSVFEEKCREVDITKEEFLKFLPHIPTRSSNKHLMKISLPHNNSFTVKQSTKGRLSGIAANPVKQS